VSLTREQVFARDGYACVYCGTEGTGETLSVDHVQPRVRGGDHSAGNVVTACMACNARKGHRRHAEFLADEPEAWRHFRQRAAYVWPRHLDAVTEELTRRSRTKHETRTNLRG
jgi:5-methylcytosine-specific restriction endonuclease McrA